MFTFIARVIFYALILRDPKPTKFIPVRHKIWAGDGSPINPIAEQAAKAI